MDKVPIHSDGSTQHIHIGKYILTVMADLHGKTSGTQHVNSRTIREGGDSPLKGDSIVPGTPGPVTERMMALHDRLQGVKQGHNKRGMADTEHEGDAVANWKPEAQRIWSRRPHSRILPDAATQKLLGRYRIHIF